MDSYSETVSKLLVYVALAMASPHSNRTVTKTVPSYEGICAYHWGLCSKDKEDQSVDCCSGVMAAGWRELEEENEQVNQLALETKCTKFSNVYKELI